MKDYIEERAIEIANFIIDEKATVRQTAKKFGGEIYGTYGSDNIERFVWMVR